MWQQDNLKQHIKDKTGMAGAEQSLCLELWVFYVSQEKDWPGMTQQGKGHLKNDLKNVEQSGHVQSEFVEQGREEWWSKGTKMHHLVSGAKHIYF